MINIGWSFRCWASSTLRQKTPPDYCACFLTFSLHFSVLMHFQRLRDPLRALVIVILSVENTPCSKTHWTAQMKNFSHSPYWLWVSSDWARWGCNSDPSGDIVLLTVEYHSMLQAGSSDRSEVHRGFKQQVETQAVSAAVSVTERLLSGGARQSGWWDRLTVDHDVREAEWTDALLL